MTGYSYYDKQRNNIILKSNNVIENLLRAKSAEKSRIKNNSSTGVSGGTSEDLQRMIDVAYDTDLQIAQNDKENTIYDIKVREFNAKRSKKAPTMLNHVASEAMKYIYKGTFNPFLK